VLVVDAANVVGSRPDGWWRDRAGAARRLVDAITAAVADGALDGPVVVVLEGAARAGVAAGAVGPGVTVVHAPGAGDDAIVAATADAVGAAPTADTVRVVTADRALRARVTALGAGCVGPGWLRDRC
jgi:hypothetical protein